MTAGERLVMLSGIGSATAAMHLMSIVVNAAGLKISASEQSVKVQPTVASVRREEPAGRISIQTPVTQLKIGNSTPRVRITQ